MTDLAFILSFLIVSWALGKKVFSRAGVCLEDPCGEIAFSSAAGLGILAYGVLALGLAGLFFREVILGMLLVAAALTYGEIKDLIRMLWLELKRVRIRLGLFEGSILLLFVITFSATLLGALGPELGNDSLCYHLEDPKVFIQNHRIEYLPYSENSLFPYLTEMLFSIGLLLKGEIAAKLFHWLAGVLAFLGTISLGLRHLKPFFAFLAGAIFLLTPGIHNQMATAYIDISLVLMTLLAYYALSLWWQAKNSQWLLLAGVFSGLALSVKYQGLYSFLVAGLAIFAESARQGTGIRGVMKNLGIYFLAVFAFSFIWYLRSYWHTGTPIYPYFSTNFGGAPYQIDLERNGMGKSILSFILLFWNFTMYPAVFGGTGNQYGIIFLLFLPFLFLVKRTSSIHFLLLISFVHIVVWFSLRHNIRYLFPIVPLLSILVAYTVQGLIGRSALLSRVTKIALIFVFLLNTGMAAYHVKDVYKVSLGLETKEAYLKKTERSFEVAEFVNRTIPPTEKILNAEEIRAFYFKPRMIREQIYRRWTRYHEKSRNGEEVIQFLKKDGFNYLLITTAPGQFDKQVTRHPLDIRELANDQAFVARYLTELYSGRFVDEEAREWRHFLYRIK